MEECGEEGAQGADGGGGPPVRTVERLEEEGSEEEKEESEEEDLERYERGEWGERGAAALLAAATSGGPAQQRSLEAVLLAAAMPSGTSVGYALAHRLAPPRCMSRDTPGAVVRVALGSRGAHSVWYISALRAAVDPALKGVAVAAAARGTFAILCVGKNGREDRLAVAEQHAAAPPGGAEPLLRLERAMQEAWGQRRARRAWRWAGHPPAPLLPDTMQWLDRYREVVRERAAAEAAAGQAKERSEKSLELRAAAVMLARDMQRQLLRAPHSAAPGGLQRRAAGKAITAVLCASEGTGASDKPFYWDIEGIVTRAGWKRVSRLESGFDKWEYLPPPGVGQLRLVDARRLGEAYLASVGEGGVPNDHILWTALNEIRGHTQAVAPHLQAALDEAHAQGEPLWLFDRESPEPLPEGRELEAFLAQVDRVEAQGSWKELTPEQQQDRAQCAAVAWVGCVYKTALQRTTEEEQAVASNDVRALARLAEARGQAIVAQLGVALDEAAEGSPQGAPLHPATRLEHIIAGAAGSITKARPVARFQALSRGDERLGLEPDGVLPSGCTTPQLIELLVGATSRSLLARHDAVDFFYSIALSLAGRALTCLAVMDPRVGRLRIFQLQVLCMGQCSAPAVAELVSSLVALIANARGAAQGTCAGFSALCDDFIAVAERGDLERASRILLQLMEEVGITESAGKRVWGQQGECLGKNFDMERGVVSVPPARLHQYLVSLHVALAALKSEAPAVRQAVTKDMLSRLAGVLQWISETTVCGVLHMGALYAVTARGKSIARCRERVVADLEWWAAEATAGRLNATMTLSKGAVFVAAADASDVAKGVVTPDIVLWEEMDAYERGLSSTRREVRAATLLLRERGATMAGGTLVLSMDSLPAVLAINKGRLKGKGGMRDVRALYHLLERHGLHLVALWIPREFNQAPDEVSKCASLREFEALALAHDWDPVC